MLHQIASNYKAENTVVGGADLSISSTFSKYSTESPHSVAADTETTDNGDNNLNQFKKLSNTTERHLHLSRNSCVPDEITRLNIKSLKGAAVLDYLISDTHTSIS